MIKPSDKTQLELNAAMDEFQQINHQTRSLWGSVTALRNHVDEKLAALVETMKHLSGNPLHLGNSLGFAYNEVRHRHELANLKVLTDHLTSSAEYAAADALVAPAVAKVREAEAAHADAVDAENRAEQARRNAIEAAKQEAIAQIEAEFSQQEPSAPEPSRPFRGRNLKPSQAATAAPENVESDEPAFT